MRQWQGLWLSFETPALTSAAVPDPDSGLEPQTRSRSSSSALARMTP